MVSQELQDLLAPRIRVMRVMWVNLVFGVFMMTVLCFVLASRAGGERSVGEETLPVLTGVFALLGVSCACASVLVPMKVFSEQRLARLMAAPIDLKEIACHPQTGRVDEGLRDKLEALPDEEQKTFLIVCKSVGPSIMAAALAESVSVFGFAYGFVTRTPTLCLPFSVIALAFVLLAVPRPMAIADRARLAERLHSRRHRRGR